MVRPTLHVEQHGAGACSFVVRSSEGQYSAVPIAAIALAVIASIFSAGALTFLPSTLFFLLCWLQWRRLRVSEESLTAIEGIGLQLCTRCACGRETSQFIEIAAISAIFLNEAVRFDRCYFYLACLLHGDERRGQPRLVVPFRHLLPPLEDLQHVYHGARTVLWRGAEPAGA